MNTIILNASPRKNMNTAQLLQAAKRGAQGVGDNVTYIDLYDLQFAGCHSCLVCKQKGIEDPWRCRWQDELTPVLEKIYTADRLIVGTPMYFSDTTACFRALLERLTFPMLSYNNHRSTFKGRVRVDVFLTMNVTPEFYKDSYEKDLRMKFSSLYFLNGGLHIHPSCDTMQVADYSKYEMASWDPVHKQVVHDTRFPKELEHAYQVGALR